MSDTDSIDLIRPWNESQKALFDQAYRPLTNWLKNSSLHKCKYTLNMSRLTITVIFYLTK